MPPGTGIGRRRWHSKGIPLCSRSSRRRALAPLGRAALEVQLQLPEQEGVRVRQFLDLLSNWFAGPVTGSWLNS